MEKRNNHHGNNIKSNGTKNYKLQSTERERSTTQDGEDSTDLGKNPRDSSQTEGKVVEEIRDTNTENKSVVFENEGMIGLQLLQNNSWSPVVIGAIHPKVQKKMAAQGVASGDAIVRVDEDIVWFGNEEEPLSLVRCIRVYKLFPLFFSCFFMALSCFVVVS